LRRRIALQDVATLERHPPLDARLGQVTARSIQRLRVDVAAVEAQIGLFLLFLLLRLYGLPRARLEAAQLLEPKVALRAGSAPPRHGCCLYQKRAAAAHRVEQRRFGLPAGEHHDAGGEILA
jgi:hypothetical protein